MRITALKQSLAAVLANMDGLLQAATDDGGRDLTAEELTKFEAFKTEADGLESSIKREEDLLRLKSTSALPVSALTPSTDTPVAGTLPKTYPAAAEKLEGGVAFARIVTSFAAVGMDQRAAADHASKVWGSDFGQIVANMEQSTDVKGGFLVEKTFSRDFIDILRPNVVVRKMGARTVPMASGNLNMRKKTASSQAAYVGERQPIPATNPQIGQISMSAKKLAALVPISNELLRHADIGVDALVRDDLTESVAVKEDQQFIRGAGSDMSPKGLSAMMAVGNKIAAPDAQTVGAVDGALARLRLKVFTSGVPMIQCGYLVSPRTYSFLETLRDGNGNKVYPELSQGKLGAYPIEQTVSIPDNLGVGGDESEIYFGSFAQFLIGDTYALTIATSTEASYVEDGVTRSAFQNDETLIRVIEEHDTALRYDTAFAMLQGVTWVNNEGE